MDTRINGHPRAALRLPHLDESKQPAAGIVKRTVTVTMLLIAGGAVFALIAASLVRMDVTVRARGALEPAAIWQVRAEEGGVVRDVLAGTGDTVEAGADLVRLDAFPLQASLSQLEAQLRALGIDARRLAVTADLEQQDNEQRRRQAQARLTAARAALLQRMVEHGLGTDVDSLRAVHVPGEHVAMDVALSEFDSALADARTSEGRVEATILQELDLERLAAERARLVAQIDEARLRLERMTIRTPRSGVVVTERVDRLQGSYVQQGAVLFEVAAPGAWHAHLSLSERDVHRVRVGDRVRVDVQAWSAAERRPLEGRITSISYEPVSPAAQTLPAVYQATVEFPHDPLDGHPLALVRRGFTVEGHVITRSGRISTLVWHYLRDRLDGR